MTPSALKPLQHNLKPFSNLTKLYALHHQTSRGAALVCFTEVEGMSMATKTTADRKHRPHKARQLPSQPLDQRNSQCCLHDRFLPLQKRF